MGQVYSRPISPAQRKALEDRKKAREVANKKQASKNKKT